MAFDVNSLGGKLIDNKELLKLIEQGGGGGGSSAFEIRSGDNVFMPMPFGDYEVEPYTFEQLGALWEEHNGNIIVRHVAEELPPSRLYFRNNRYETQSFSIITYGGLSDGLGVSTQYICLTSDGYLQDTESELYGYHTWVVSAQNDD